MAHYADADQPVEIYSVNVFGIRWRFAFGFNKNPQHDDTEKGNGEMNCHQKPILYFTLDLLTYTFGFFDRVHA